MKEVESLEEMVLLAGIFERNDTKGVIMNHCKMVRLTTTYDHK